MKEVMSSEMMFRVHLLTPPIPSYTHSDLQDQDKSVIMPRPRAQSRLYMSMKKNVSKNSSYLFPHI